MSLSKCFQGGGKSSTSMNAETEEIVARAIRRRNIALLFCMVHDMKDISYVSLLEGAMAAHDHQMRLTQDMIDLIESDHYADVQVFEKKFKLIAVIRYFNDIIQHTVPLLDNFPVSVQQLENAAYFFPLDVTNNDVQIYENDPLFVCKTSDLHQDIKNFKSWHGVACKHQNRFGVMMNHCDETFPFAEVEALTILKRPSIREIEFNMQAINCVVNDENVRQKLMFGQQKRAAHVPRSKVKLSPDAIYDSTQSLAIDEIVNQTPEYAQILFGPPGTGKTTVLVEAIEQLSLKRRPILVCVPTNVAGDEICGRLVRRKKVQRHEIHRLYSTIHDPDLIDENVASVCLISQIRDPVTSTEYRKFSVPENDSEYKQHLIIVTTIGSCWRLQSLGKNYFSTIIFDEAGQTDELDILTVMAMFCGKETCVHLAGDPQQLGKVNMCDVLMPYNEHVNKSILQRLSEHSHYKNNSNLMIMLLFNYRSEEHIMRLYSALSYDNQLISTRPKGHDSFRGAYVVGNNSTPIRFHVCKSEETRNGELSYSNLVEAQIVVQYVFEIMKMRVQGDEIGVVVPYSAQQNLIQSLLKKHNIYNVLVATVARYQGAERRVIICSFVRQKDIGFLSDEKLTNTAISRAQQLLILVGNPDNLQQLDYFKNMMRMLQAENAVFYGRESGAKFVEKLQESLTAEKGQLLKRR